MSLTAAAELVRILAQDIGLDDVDFADLGLALLVDDVSVTLEYVPDAQSFVVYGRVAEQANGRDADFLRRVHDYSHASAMMGGGSLTMDSDRGDVWYVLRLDIAGLTAEMLGLRMGQVATAVAAYGPLLAEIGADQRRPPEATFDVHTIRV